ncbi:MAG: hypothetical protein RLO52_10545 [Sandaracinaceae bacterium]
MALRTFILTLVVTLAAGCQVYDPSLVEEDSGVALPDTGPATLRHPPPRPTGMDGDDGEERLYGLRMVMLNQDGERWRDIGYDLDGRFTAEPGFDTECLPPRRSRPPVDGNQGIDNVFGASLFPLVDLTVPGLQETAQAAQEEGKLPVLRMRGWNGEDDDPRVDITVTNAIFMTAAESDGSPPEVEVVDFEPRRLSDGTRPDFPAWDGTDYGWFREETFLEGDPELPLLRDDNAYVAGRLVVARLPERVEILFPADDLGVIVKLTDARATGTISADGSTLENVVVAGRWAIIDLLSTAENVGVCRDTAQYDILTGQLDTIADIRSAAGSGGEGVRCDAISLGVQFTGSRLRWGGLTPGPPVRNVCTDPRTDGGPSGMDGGMSGARDGGVADGG